ncbi:MAG TPA: hypothetical protein PKK56_01215 [archaeon]|nr:hypothetical protein [archaeon]HPC10082.1 hypothetical protein [archaeon]HRT02517.1 hypothetical protein [Candidatus Diapherotrites archaeon]
MSIYKENKIKTFFIENKKPIIIWATIICILIIIVIIVTSINPEQLFKKNNISVKYTENPLNIKKDTFTSMLVTIKNDSGKDTENIIVKIQDIEPNNFLIFCENSLDENTNIILIQNIAKDNKRTIKCDIRSIDPDTLLEGTYSFDIFYKLDGNVYTKRTTLDVIKK